MTKPTTQTVINKIKDRVNPEFKLLTQFVETYDSVLPVINDSTTDLGEALRGYEELNRILRDIYNNYQASLGHMAEGRELLNELIEGSANTVLLINNIVDVFMQSDYSILVQALLSLDPPLRREALKKIPLELRIDLITELGMLDK